jgi:hypothetical protein
VAAIVLQHHVGKRKRVKVFFGSDARGWDQHVLIETKRLDILRILTSHGMTVL